MVVDLENLVGPVQAALAKISRRLDGKIEFLSDDLRFQLTPDKGYTAKASVPALYRGQTLGDLHIIGFSPGDGTGNESTYSASQLVVPSDLQFAQKPSRVFPRSKQGIHTELYFRILSVTSHSEIAPLLGSLHLLGIEADQKTICTIGILGEDPEVFPHVHGEPASPLLPELTTGYPRNCNRFGDPHAVYCPLDSPTRIQIAGFLPILHSTHALLGDVMIYRPSQPKNF